RPLAALTAARNRPPTPRPRFGGEGSRTAPPGRARRRYNTPAPRRRRGGTGTTAWQRGGRMLWEIEIQPRGHDAARDRVCEEYDLPTHSRSGPGLVTRSARGYPV